LILAKEQNDAIKRHSISTRKMFLVHTNPSFDGPVVPVRNQKKQNKLRVDITTAGPVVPVRNQKKQNKLRVDIATADAKVAEIKWIRAQQQLKRIQEIQARQETIEKEGVDVSYNRLMQMTEDFKPDGLSMVVQNVTMKKIDESPLLQSNLANRSWDVTTGDKKVPSNQLFSGRCWMFAGLNILVRQCINIYKFLPTFELSQSYLFFWHYVEQYNDILSLFYYEEKLRNTHSEERQDILENPVQDGGNWITFLRLVLKFGVVPKSLYDEKMATKSSAEMRDTIANMLANAILHMEKKEKMDKSAFNIFRDEQIKDVVHVLCTFMGRPPVSGIIKLHTSEPSQQNLKLEFASPLELFWEINQTGAAVNVDPIDINNHVQVIHDCRVDERDIDEKMKLSKDKTWYATTYQSRQSEKNVLYNIRDMNKIIEIVLISLQMKHPVWFACNICTDVDTTRQGMTNELYRPDLLLRTAYKNKMTKKERMNYGRAKCNHAMLIVGAETEPYGKVDHDGKQSRRVIAFNVENSWGKDGDGGGFYKMDTEWFKERAYTVVVHRDIIERVMSVKLIAPTANVPVIPRRDFFG
jgi:bleomycin hydrolase